MSRMEFLESGKNICKRAGSTREQKPSSAILNRPFVNKFPVPDFSLKIHLSKILLSKITPLRRQENLSKPRRILLQ